MVLDEKTIVRELLQSYTLSKKAQEIDHANYFLNLIDDNNISKEDIKLSKREQQVLSLLSDGFPDKTIGRTLDVSINTIRFHLKNIYAKLNVTNRMQAVREAKNLD